MNVNHERRAAILIFTAGVATFLTFLGLVLILGLDIDYYNFSKPEARAQTGEPPSYAEMPGLVALLLVIYVIPLFFSPLSMSVSSMLLLRADLPILKQVMSLLINSMYFCCILLSTTIIYTQLFGEETADIEMLIRLNAIWYIFFNVGLGLGVTCIGLGAFWSQTLPLALTRILILCGIVSLPLTILLANPTQPLYSLNLNALLILIPSIMVGDYLWIAATASDATIAR